MTTKLKKNIEIEQIPEILDSINIKIKALKVEDDSDIVDLSRKMISSLVLPMPKDLPNFSINELFTFRATIVNNFKTLSESLRDFKKRNKSTEIPKKIQEFTYKGHTKEVWLHNIDRFILLELNKDKLQDLEDAKKRLSVFLTKKDKFNIEIKDIMEVISR